MASKISRRLARSREQGDASPSSYRFLAARWSQHGRVIAERDSLVRWLIYAQTNEAIDLVRLLPPLLGLGEFSGGARVPVLRRFVFGLAPPPLLVPRVRE